MGLLSSDMSDKEFDKLAFKAGYGRYGLGGSYSTAAEYETATNQARLWHTQPVIPGISKNDLINKLNAETARQTPIYQQNFALDQQKPAIDQQKPALDQQKSASDQQNFAIDRQNSTSGRQNFALDQQNFAIGQQNSTIDQQQSLLNDSRKQQALALGQRNAAVDDALNNAQRTSGPGQSVYDQRLQQMMNGTFAPDDPSYQWRVQQGMTNLGRSQAAKGMLGSGNMAAELLSYGQGMASQEYGSQFNRLLAASQNATAQYTNAYGVLNQMLQQQQGQQQQGNADNLTAQGWGRTAQDWGQTAQGWGKTANDLEQIAQGWGHMAQGWGQNAQGWGKNAQDWVQTAQNWGQTAQGWGSQNLGITNADTSRYGVTSNAANQAGQLSLQRDQFNAQQKRLDNADRGSGDALMRGAGNNSNNSNNGGQFNDQYDRTYGYKSPSSGGSVQNNVASELQSGTGYIRNNQTGDTTQFGDSNQGSQSPFTNDYGYEAVYGD